MWKLAIGLFIGALLWAPDANAQYARQELLAFESATMSVGDFLTGKKGTPVTLAGDLRLPKANEKNPVVIVLHSGAGLGGATDAVADWVRVLNEAGIATFTIDSFTPRGILSSGGCRTAQQSGQSCRCVPRVGVAVETPSHQS